MRLLAVTLLVALAITGASGDVEYRRPPSRRIIAAGRDLKQYEDGGDFRNDPFADRKTIPHVERLREFIWRHWTEKRRGYIRLLWSGTDTNFLGHFFIEPDESGQWLVRYREVYVWGDMQKTRWTLREPVEYVSVERDSPNERDAAGASVLVLKGKDGHDFRL